jgi:hypothetical protein
MTWVQFPARAMMELVFITMSRPALGPTQPPVQCVPEVKRPCVILTTHIHPVSSLRSCGAIPPLPQYFTLPYRQKAIQVFRLWNFLNHNILLKMKQRKGQRSLINRSFSNSGACAVGMLLVWKKMGDHCRGWYVYVCLQWRHRGESTQGKKQTFPAHNELWDELHELLTACNR